MSAERPVYFQMVHEGNEVRVLVENLSTGGALLMCPGVYESLHTGQTVSDGMLILSDANSARVNVVVRWQLWPRAGVQFEGLSRRAAEQLSEFVESLKPSVVPVPDLPR